MIARFLIYLSFLSFPGAEELGLLPLTATYFTLALLAPVATVVTRPSAGLFVSCFPMEAVQYLVLLLLFLPLNFLIAQLNDVEPVIWLSRAVHLALVPAFYLCFKFSKTHPDTIFKDICIVGFVEALLIYVAFFAYTYLYPAELRRATDLGGIIVYSVFLLCAAFYALRKYELVGRNGYLLTYFLVLLAGILTGTRVLMISLAMLLLTLVNKRRAVLLCTIFALPIASLAAFGFFERFDLGDEDNIITIFSKIEELGILFQFFLGSPLLGVGLGKPYQVSGALSEYNYSHNMPLFYLGYAGLVGAAIALYPLIRWLWLRDYRVFVLALFLFYTSSTSFTNVKHSILLAFALLILEHRQRPRHRYAKPPLVNLAASR